MSKANDLANINSATVGITATVTTGNVALGAIGDGVMVTNLGANPVWCSTGIGSGTTAAATTGTGCCVAPGTVQTFQMDRQHTYLAAISTGGNSLLSVSVTNGK